jgi:hypothetical protein
MIRTSIATLEADFKDPWTALDLAFHLSVQVAQDLHEGLPFVHNLSGSPRGLGRRSALRNTCTRVVNFAPEVDLHIGDDDELYMVQLTIPHASLWKPDKPWSLLPKACFHDQHSLDDPHILMSKGDTNSAPIHQSDIGRCTHTGLIQLSETVDTKMPDCFNSDAQPDITSVSPMAQPEEVQAEVLPLTDLHDDSSWHWIVQFFTRDLQPLFLPSLGQMYHPHKKQMVASSFVRHFLGLHAQSQGSSF